MVQLACGVYEPFGCFRNWVLPGFSGGFYLVENEQVKSKSPETLGIFSVRPQGGASWGSKLAPLLV